MKEKFKIVLSWSASNHEVKEYQAVVSDHCRIINPQSQMMPDLIAAAAEADGIIGAYIPQEMIEAAPGLKMVQILHAGVATAFPGDIELGFKTESLARRGIVMGNIHGNSLAVAEHAMAFILAFAKHLEPANRALSQGDWLPVTDEYKSYVLADSTLGIVGLGHIGVQVAKFAKAFNMRVIGSARNPHNERLTGLNLDFVGTPDDLPRILSDSDFVLLTVPLTSETYNLIGERELKKMKPDAYLINIARSHLIDEKALHKALTEKWIRGYASDVWWFYSCASSMSVSEPWFNFGFHCPVPSRLGINRMSNVIGTGDRAAFTRGVAESFIHDGLKNLDAFARHGEPLYRVNIELGY